MSLDTSSVTDEDVQWPSEASTDQIALNPGNQKEFEKFVKKKHEQVKQSLSASLSVFSWPTERK